MLCLYVECCVCVCSQGVGALCLFARPMEQRVYVCVAGSVWYICVLRGEWSVVCLLARIVVTWMYGHGKWSVLCVLA